MKNKLIELKNVTKTYIVGDKKFNDSFNRIMF